MEAGYDKVKLWIDRTIVGGQYPTIVNYLDSPKQQTDIQTGEVKTFGRVKGVKVSISAGGLSIIGSLPKFLFGSNVYPLNKRAAAQALEKLADTLHIQVGEAVVTGIEFGANYLMKRPVAEYLSKLGTMPRFHRLQITDYSIRYEGKGKGKTRPKVFAFYDKIADAAAKRMEYPEGLENLLRYEIRLNGRLPYQLSVPEVKASTLTKPDFYRQMVKYYQDSYFSISKSNQIKTDVMNDNRTPNAAFDVLVAMLINQNPSFIEEFLVKVKQAGVFTDRKYYSRLKAMIKKKGSKANITISDDLIKELDDEIKNSGAYV